MNNKINFENIGKQLREIRQKKGYTQEYIAKMAGVNTSHISNIENNHVRISLQTLILVCNALDVTVDYILKNEYNNSNSSVDNEIKKELNNCSNDEKEIILKIIRAIKS